MNEYWTIVKDNEGHTYLIPFNKMHFWDLFLESQDYKDGIEPNYVVRIEGKRVIFSSYKLVN